MKKALILSVVALNVMASLNALADPSMRDLSLSTSAPTIISSGGFTDRRVQILKKAAPDAAEFLEADGQEKVASPILMEAFKVLREERKDGSKPSQEDLARQILFEVEHQ